MSLPQEARKPLGELLGGLRFAFPDDADAPAKFSKLTSVLLISPLIACKLGLPIMNPRFRNVRVNAAWMPVPEATPNLNDPLEPRQHNVRSAWEFVNVQTKSEAHPMNQSPHNDLRRRVPAPYSAHVCGAAFWGDCIHGRDPVSSKRPSYFSTPGARTSADCLGNFRASHRSTST